MKTFIFPCDTPESVTDGMVASFQRSGWEPVEKIVERGGEFYYAIQVNCKDVNIVLNVIKRYMMLCNVLEII